MADRDDEVGALWIKQGRGGEFLSGKVNGIDVVCFPIRDKKNSKQPDWRVLKSRPKAESAPAPRRGEDPEADWP